MISYESQNKDPKGFAKSSEGETFRVCSFQDMFKASAGMRLGLQ